MSLEAPYALSSTILDCKQPSSGYSKPSYPSKPNCDSIYPNCDNRSYSAYALDASYNGVYDNCFITSDFKPACDLKYVNAPPKVVLGCWQNCCNDQLRDCNMNCHVDCVVSGGKMPGPNPNPMPAPGPSPVPSPSSMPMPGPMPSPSTLNTYLKNV